MKLTIGTIGKIDFAELSPLKGDEEAKRLQMFTNLGSMQFFCLVKERLPGHLLIVHILGGQGRFIIREEYLSVVSPLRLDWGEDEEEDDE